jgi:hypothetical protein
VWSASFTNLNPLDYSCLEACEGSSLCTKYQREKCPASNNNTLHVILGTSEPSGRGRTHGSRKNPFMNRMCK